MGEISIISVWSYLLRLTYFIIVHIIVLGFCQAVLQNSLNELFVIDSGLGGGFGIVFILCDEGIWIGFQKHDLVFRCEAKVKARISFEV